MRGIVRAQPAHAPDRPFGHEISGALVIGGDIGKEGSAHKPGGGLAPIPWASKPNALEKKIATW